MKILPPISEDDKMLAGLPYVVWPIGSLFILASRKKEDPFLYYHAIQALFAGGVLALGTLFLTLGLFLVFRVMPATATYAPAVFSMGVVFGGGALLVTLFLIALFLGWRATEGEMLRIPYVGDFAEERMLDQTGMTRRQFESLLETSTQPEPEEEIPFPEARPAAVASPARSTNRVDAMRQARSQASQAEAPTEFRAPIPQPRAPQPPVSQPAPPRPQTQPPAHQARPTQRFPESPTPSAPRVKEVDLIGHYKDKKVDAAANSGKGADVLRQWLSSVDES